MSTGPHLQNTRGRRNTNTGGVIARESEEQMITAVNHIHHGPNHPSRLVLPLIDRKDQP
ncbi:hypothetical protein [Streptomyces sp. NBC_01373]|uniref:hypothetical protein n=1 Tax=Streptomyces sp. NBC_01373 TaxID=2903843 RepID=UPI0022530CF9|nr:hypothetical protein [Streptomyces sp. NBC_01373]MCX4706854.1 hypothetical protein [Streptomyces sp. NBC_01373]